jgi:hypothetical protein
MKLRRSDQSAFSQFESIAAPGHSVAPKTRDPHSNGDEISQGQQPQLARQLAIFEDRLSYDERD